MAKSMRGAALIDKRFRKLENKIAQFKPETKFYLSSWGATSIQDSGRTPQENDLLPLAQGDGQTNRTGNSVRVTGIYGKLAIAAADTTNLVRVILYIPKDPSATMSGVSYSSSPDLDQWTILFDKMVAVSTNGPGIKSFTIKKKFNKGRRAGILSEWHSSNTGDHSKNPIRFYAVSDSTAVSDPALSGYLYVYFRDM